MRTRAATAGRSPAFHTVHAAPGAALVDFDLPFGWVNREIFAIVCHADRRVRVQSLQSVGERHVPVSVMMTIRFSVGRYVHELGMVPRIVESLLQASNDLLAGTQQPFKRHLPRDSAVIEKQSDRPAGRQAA